MRQITVSTEVFAEIWRRHKDGDQSEDDILRRELLGLLASPKTAPSEGSASAPTAHFSGYEDARSGVRFPEGFPIFRLYKGREYQAVATGGQWLMTQTGTKYSSLHKLSMAVVKGQENSWRNWKYRDPDGTEHLIDTLRARTKK